MINENSYEKVISLLNIIEDKEENNNNVFYTIKKTFFRDPVAVKWRDKSPRGAEGFREDIEVLKNDSKICLLSIELYNSNGSFHGKAFESTGNMQWNIPEVNEQSYFPAPENQHTGFGNVDIESIINQRVEQIVNPMVKDFQHREELMKKEYEINALILRLENKDDKIKELSDKLDIAEKIIAESENALVEKQKEIEELQKVNEKYKTAGLGSLADTNLNELISTAVNTSVSIGTTKLVKGLLENIGGNKPQQALNGAPEQKPEPVIIPDSEYLEI